MKLAIKKGGFALKKYVKILFVYLLIMCFSFVLGACKKSDVQTGDNIYYQITDDGKNNYHYEIISNGVVFSEGNTESHIPTIEEISEGIFKLKIGYGNTYTLQYFDVLGNRISSEYQLINNYAEYYNEKTNEVLIAHYDFKEKPILVIRDAFNDDGFYNEYDLGFSNYGCDEMKFLNENEIYLEYEISKESVTKTITFR